MISNLKIIQINLHHSKLASCCLESQILKKDISIALIQEPWVNKDGQVSGLKIKSYNLFYKSNGNKIRSCVLVKKALCSFLLDNFSDEDTVSILLEGLGNTKICLVSRYLPFDRDDVIGVRLRNLVESKQWPVIIGSDANAHHTQWGSSRK